MGTPFTSLRHLGTASVAGQRRLPQPAARITAVVTVVAACSAGGIKRVVSQPGSVRGASSSDGVASSVSALSNKHRPSFTCQTEAWTINLAGKALRDWAGVGLLLSLTVEPVGPDVDRDGIVSVNRNRRDGQRRREPKCRLTVCRILAPPPRAGSESTTIVQNDT